MSASKRKSKSDAANDQLTRIAIVSTDKCKPKRCRQECKKFCPVVRMGMFIVDPFKESIKMGPKLSTIFSLTVAERIDFYFKSISYRKVVY